MGVPGAIWGVSGTDGACRKGGGGGALCCGAELRSTTTSVERCDGARRCESGLLLRSFMRFVERVRRNCAVRS